MGVIWFLRLRIKAKNLLKADSSLAQGGMLRQNPPIGTVSKRSKFCWSWKFWSSSASGWRSRFLHVLDAVQWSTDCHLLRAAGAATDRTHISAQFVLLFLPNHPSNFKTLHKLTFHWHSFSPAALVTKLFPQKLISSQDQHQKAKIK